MLSLVICGPTATGKTKIAERIAKEEGGEIISCDTGLFYGDISIGNGRYTLSNDIEYHLLNILDKNERFNVKDYLMKARKIMKEIWERDKLPIICGGSMHYVDRFIKGIEAGPPHYPKLRKGLKRIAEMEGSETLHYILKNINPKEAARTHPNNVKRTIRKIEISMNQSNLDPIPPLKEKTLVFFLDRTDHDLLNRTRNRINEMIKIGWLEEVRGLISKGLNKDDPLMEVLGYSDIVNHLKGEMEIEETIEIIERKTIRLAKKQRKWAKRIPSKRVMIGVKGFHSDEAINMIKNDIIKM